MTFSLLPLTRGLSVEARSICPSTSNSPVGAQRESYSVLLVGRHLYSVVNGVVASGTPAATRLMLGGSLGACPSSTVV